MKKILAVLASLIISISIIGCALQKNEDGVTTGIGFSPDAKLIGDKVANTAEGLTGLLGYISPVAAATAAAAVIAWRKASKKSIKFQRPLEFYVKALENIKQESPDVWDEIKAVIKFGRPPIEVRNTVGEILDGMLKEV